MVNPIVTESVFVPSVTLCDEFCSFFTEKIVNIRSQCIVTKSVSDIYKPSVAPMNFCNFEPVCLSELTQVVKSLKPSACPLDNLPSQLFKSVFDSIGPFILKLVNMSLSSGCVPDVFKHASVQPLLKRHGLDSSVLSNFRPISKLPFLSKVLEKVAVSLGLGQYN